jgi:hypothetical protein
VKLDLSGKKRFGQKSKMPQAAVLQNPAMACPDLPATPRRGRGWEQPKRQFAKKYF